MSYKKIVIGVDQSYQDTGISICCDGELKRVSHVKLSVYKNNTERRKVLSETLLDVLKKCIRKSENVVLICERIRLKSQGFLNINYIKSIGALNATIVDAAYEFDVPVFSVDTRSWKSQIVGTSKPEKGKNTVSPEKWPTIKHVMNLGFTESITEPAGKRIKGVITIDGEKFYVNDNAADSACIALYGFLHKSKQKLEAEN